MTKLLALWLCSLASTRRCKTCIVRNLSSAKIAGIVFVFCIFAPVAAPAQTFTDLVIFDITNGGFPNGPLIQGFDGNLYSVISQGGSGPNCPGGGSYGCGTVSKITPQGAITILYSFCVPANCPDGHPAGAGLVLATDGNFYGTTPFLNGGNGTVFRISPGGDMTTLFKFDDGSDGEGPGPLVQGTDGNFYGTTYEGGANNDGAVFKITPTGTLTVLHSFDGTDGLNLGGGLVQGIDGNFYGTTNAGGPHGSGTVFKMTPSGTLTTLYSFCSHTNCADGGGPSGLVQGIDGNLYGTTSGGGANGYGTVFRLTAGHIIMTLYSFNGTNGSGTGGLMQATDGNFYGTTYAGNPYGVCAADAGCGTVFRITPEGALTTIYSFCPEQGDCTDGQWPTGGLVQATDGNLYGTTYFGGDIPCFATLGCGTVFRLSTGLAPFVSFLPAARPVGGMVEILGQGFTAATDVSFNGIAASFTVESDTYLKTTVPQGATTGNITVAEPSGTLTSNKMFRVLPQISGLSPTSGPVGTPVVITGNSFMGATTVTFDCKWQASFTVDSDTQITAIVPANATVGTITVRTPGGTVESTQTFTVTP